MNELELHVVLTMLEGSIMDCFVFLKPEEALQECNEWLDTEFTTFQELGKWQDRLPNGQSRDPMKGSYVQCYKKKIHLDCQASCPGRATKE